MENAQQRLQRLLNDPQWTPADREWLLAYLEGLSARGSLSAPEGSAAPELEQLLAALYARDLNEDHPLAEGLSEQMRRRISERTGVSMEPGLRRDLFSGVRQGAFSRTRWWAAAAAILLLASGSWFVIGRMRSAPIVAEKPARQTDATPGGNRAMLTLADGRIIQLDSAAKGELASQGHTRILKADSGLLSYRDSGSSAGATATTIAAPMDNLLQTPRGGQYQLVLPDGTKVWLNAASQLRFPTVFAGAERRVELNGEAYFEVAKTAGRTPFIVHIPPPAGETGAAPTDIEVLGTHFNINAYGDEPASSTTLLEGSIRVRKGEHSDLLKPGQQAIADNHSGLIRVADDADVDAAVAWKNGMFVFNSLPLETIMRQMQRWYDIDVRYEGPVKKVSFNGQISRYSNASRMLELLQTTGEVHFTISDKKIIVRP